MATAMTRCLLQLSPVDVVLTTDNVVMGLAAKEQSVVVDFP